MLFRSGNDIYDDNLFFISNYCFTEITETHRNSYISILFPKVKHGFIIWQTVFNLPIEEVSIITKEIIKIDKEEPQTDTLNNENYFVYF